MPVARLPQRTGSCLGREREQADCFPPPRQGPCCRRVHAEGRRVEGPPSRATRAGVGREAGCCCRSHVTFGRHFCSTCHTCGQKLVAPDQLRKEKKIQTPFENRKHFQSGGTTSAIVLECSFVAPCPEGRGAFLFEGWGETSLPCGPFCARCLAFEALQGPPLGYPPLSPPSLGSGLSPGTAMAASAGGDQEEAVGAGST